jgi:hypothetical protein
MLLGNGEDRVLADALTLAALGISVVTLVAIFYLLIVFRRSSSHDAPVPTNLESTIGEVRGSVSSLQAAVNQLLSNVGEIKSDTDKASSGMDEMMKFVALLTGSSQERGAAGEIIVRGYLESSKGDVGSAVLPTGVK